LNLLCYLCPEPVPAGVRRGVWRSAFGVRRSAFGGAARRKRRLQPLPAGNGAAFGKEPHMLNLKVNFPRKRGQDKTRIVRKIIQKMLKRRLQPLPATGPQAAQRLQPSFTAGHGRRTPLDVHRGAAARRTRFIIALPRPTSGTGSTKISWTFSWSISLRRPNNRWAAIRRSLVSLKDRTTAKFPL
jgi:hypothetical protein